MAVNLIFGSVNLALGTFWAVNLSFYFSPPVVSNWDKPAGQKAGGLQTAKIKTTLAMSK